MTANRLPAIVRIAFNLYVTEYIAAVRERRRGRGLERTRRRDQTDEGIRAAVRESPPDQTFELFYLIFEL